MSDDATYCIVRRFRFDHAPQVLKRGLTLEEAQLHCRHPETSSSTARSSEAVALTTARGPWFDGYEEE